MPGSFADNTPPSFSNTCPRNMVVYVPKCSSNALVSWNEPIATDNSGHVIVSYPAVRPPANFSIGLYHVQYSATDGAGNTANCSFIVQVASMPFLSLSNVTCNQAKKGGLPMQAKLK